MVELARSADIALAPGHARDKFSDESGRAPDPTRHASEDGRCTHNGEKIAHKMWAARVSGYVVLQAWSSTTQRAGRPPAWRPRLGCTCCGTGTRNLPAAARSCRTTAGECACITPAVVLVRGVRLSDTTRVCCWPRCEPHEMIFIGDRYLTDVVFGNRHGMLTIRVTPLTSKGEPPTVAAARVVEEACVSRWSAAGLRAPAHRLLSVEGVGRMIVSTTESSSRNKK